MCRIEERAKWINDVWAMISALNNYRRGFKQTIKTYALSVRIKLGRIQSRARRRKRRNMNSNFTRKQESKQTVNNVRAIYQSECRHNPNQSPDSLPQWPASSGSSWRKSPRCPSSWPAWPCRNCLCLSLWEGWSLPWTPSGCSPSAERTWIEKQRPIRRSVKEKQKEVKEKRKSSWILAKRERKARGEHDMGRIEGRLSGTKASGRGEQAVEEPYGKMLKRRSER